MGSLSWQIYGLAIVIIAIPTIWGIRAATRKSGRSRKKPDHRSWDVEKNATSRIGKPVLSRTHYSGSMDHNIHWEIDAVTKSELTYYSHMNLENVPVFRTNFYTTWQTELTLLQDDYVVIHPKNILDIYISDQNMPNSITEKQIEQKLQRSVITDMRRLFNLSIAKSEEIFHSMSHILTSNQTFHRRFVTYGTSPHLTESIVTEELQSILATWDFPDTCIGLSPGRTIVLISGKDLTDQFEDLEHLAQVGEMILKTD